MKELFNQWLESKDTTKNIIEHLKEQEPFHLDFLKFAMNKKQEEKEAKCYGLHSTDFNGKCFNCGKQVFIRK